MGVMGVARGFGHTTPRDGATVVQMYFFILPRIITIRMFRIAAGSGPWDVPSWRFPNGKCCVLLSFLIFRYTETHKLCRKSVKQCVPCSWWSCRHMYAMLSTFYLTEIITSDSWGGWFADKTLHSHTNPMRPPYGGRMGVAPLPPPGMELLKYKLVFCYFPS